MFIEKIKIDDFGGTENREISFENDLNIIEGDNESGKSTVCAFMRFILFGFSDKKERMRRYSFGHNSVSGSMIVNVGGKRFRIEREYAEKSGDKCSIIDLDINAPVSEGVNPGEYFLSVYGDVYDHTAFINQTAGGFVNGATVSDAIENILFGADETINTQKALKRLDEARIMLSHKRGDGGRINELKQEKERLEALLDKAKQSNAQLIERRGAVLNAQRAIEENTNKAQQNKELIEYYETAAAYRTYKQYRHMSKNAAEMQVLYDALTEQYTYEGFLPDDEYIERLRYLIDETDSIDESIRMLQKEINDLEASNSEIFDSSTFVEKAEELGGAEKLCDDFDGIQDKKNLFSALAIIFAVFGIGVGVGGWFFTSIITQSFFLGLGVGVVFIVLSVIFLILSNKQRMNLQMFLVELDLNSAEEFENALTNYEENANKIEEHNKKTAEYDKAFTELNNERTKTRDEAMTLAMKWGRSDPTAALRKAEELVRRLYESSSEAQKFSMSRDLLKAQVAGLNKDELKAKLNGRPYDEDAFDKQEVEAAITQREFYLKMNENLREKISSLDNEIAVILATSGDALEIDLQIKQIDKQIKFLSEKHASLLLAYKKLEEASSGLRSAVIPKLTDISGDIMSAVTDGKYSALGIGKKFDLKYDFNEKNHPIDYLSEGSRDVAYYALRLALVKVLYSKQFPSIIFDESFSHLDDNRLNKMFAVLCEISEADIQFLIFTSQKREAKILREITENFNHILIQN